MRRDLAAVLGVTSILIGAISIPVHAQQQPRDTYLVEFSTVPMVRNAALVEPGVRLIERGADWALNQLTNDLFLRKSLGGFFARLGRWTLFDVFVAGTGSAVAHEYGHATRVEELGRVATVHIGFNSGRFSTRGAPLTASDRLSIFAGGLEGGYVLWDRVSARAYRRGSATPGELTMMFVTAVASESYILRTLSADRLSSPQRLLNDGRPGPLGDPVQWTLGFSAARLSRSTFTTRDVTEFFDVIQANARSIRRASLLNLLDYEYTTTVMGLFRDYLWRGERRVPVRWLELGSVSLVPAMSYRLSWLGPELQVKTRYKLGHSVGRVYARWTEPARREDARLLGAGGELAPMPPGLLMPTIGLDVWRNPDGSKSMRGELAAMFSRSSDDRLVLTAAVGAKGRGYLLGYPDERGAYVTVGGGVRF